MRRVVTGVLLSSLPLLCACELYRPPPAGAFEPSWKKEKRRQIDAWLTPLKPVAAIALLEAEKSQY